jgi:ATP-dependent helicase/nuclease subunit A
MQAVDAVFALPEHARGLVFDGAARPEIHDTVRRNAPGTVDIWPLAANDTGEPPDAWTTPVDAPERRGGTVKLADRIARTLQRWHRDRRDDLGHPFAAGDVMILLRQRGALFEAIVKALKDADVPVAGRDRLTLAEHPAVEDLVVLGRALLLPDDDLTLATALKTPLIDLDDDDLLRLAPNRQGSLRTALQKAAAEEPRYAAAEAKLVHWTQQAGRQGPFRFFADLLGPGSGRNLALARLGAEAGDALDAFLNAALDHERRYGPSLAGFLQHVAGSAADVKRDLSASAGEVRVMTVHGSKGLEAKIVILADLGVEPGARRLPKILAVPTPSGGLVPLWPPASAEDVGATAAAKALVVAQMVEEHHRLLYVAMTRAEDRLIVCGAQPKGEAPPGSWYAMIEQGLVQSDAGLKLIGEGDDTSLRFMVSAPSSMEHEASRLEGEAKHFAVPDWLAKRVVREAEPLPPLKPSSALTAADGEERPGDGPFLAEAAAAGRLAHLLLQVLPGVPETRRLVAAEALAEARGGALRLARRATIVADAVRLLAAPALAGLFALDALAEVPVAGSIRMPDGEWRAVSGRIDRLAVTADAVIVADFKTTARPPREVDAIPVTSVAQLAAYAALMREIYPGRTVRALAIYTASLTCFELDAGRRDQALGALAAGEGGSTTEGSFRP